ncbi:MAG: hypothetical protein JSS81_05070 [Acidobacteria bacterium]|nr:hypothetical protein [Acidobacteriota bacterium]
MNKSILFVICFSLLLAFSAAAQTDPYLEKYRESVGKNPKDVEFTIKFKNDQTRFRQGEIISLELRFSASTGDRYDFLNRTYDRSGRLYLDDFVIDKKEQTFDPLDDYYYRGEMLLVGGLFSVPTLGASWQIINYDLNEYFSFREPGKYRLYIVSPRVSLKTGDKKAVDNAMFGGSDIELTSNILEFEILPADEKWQAEKFAEALQGNCKVLRFLGTKAAAKEMLLRFGRGDTTCEFDNYIGLFGSPERRFIVDEMERMLSAPDFAVTDDFFQVLLRLRYFLDNPKTERDETIPYEIFAKREEKKKNLIKLDYLEKLLKALPGKSKTAFQTSLETYFGFHAAGEKTPPAEITAALIDSFGSLSKLSQWRILQNSLDKLKTPAMLPVLKSIYDGLEKTDLAAYDFFYDRELFNQSISGIYGLDRNAGKRIVLDELRRPKQKVYTSVLELLPPSETPEAENILLEKLNAGNIPADDLSSVFSLIGYYETPKLRARLREVYADKIAQADCAAQLEFLRIFLKSDLKFGEETLDKIVGTEAGKGCVGANPERALEPYWSAAIERVVTGLLESDNVTIAGDVAGMLGKYGSAGARDKIWKRLERFNKEEQSKKDFATLKDSNKNWQFWLAEWQLAAALSEASNWRFEQESNDRLAGLCLYDGCRKQVEKLNKIFRVPARIESFRDDENKLSFSVYQYKNMSLDELKKKLEQFPPDTSFTWVSSAENPNDAKDFQEIKAFLEARQMKLK